MAARTFVFDGQFAEFPPPQLGSGLKFGFSRNIATVGTDGNVLPAEDARFHTEQRLLCGAPDVRVDLTPESIGRVAAPVAVGFSHNGTTALLAAFFDDLQSLRIYSVDASGILSLYATSPSSGSVTFPGDDNLYSADDSYGICQGLLYRVCKVTKDEARSTAVIWANLSDPSMSPTTVEWKSPTNVPSDSQVGKDRGARFQHTGYCVFPENIDSDGRIDRIWIAFADYVKNGSPFSDVGRFFLATASRGSTAAWTMHTTRLVYETPPRVLFLSPTEPGQHAHNAFVEQFGKAGLRMVMAVGDFQTRNRVVASTCDKADDYDTATWDEDENRHGEWLTTTTQQACGDGNQFVGSAALGTPTNYGGRIIGSDEMIVPLSKLVVPSDPGDLYNFTRLYGGPTSSFNRLQGQSPNYVWNTFFVMKPTPESAGPYVAWVCPGNQELGGWLNNSPAKRILFSPDGLHWGQAWAPNTGDANQPVQTIGGRIFAPTRTVGRGLRSIPVPAYRLFQPLLVGVGGTNLLASGTGNGLIGGTTDTDNAVTTVTTTALDAAGVTRPPCMGPIHKCVAGGANGSLIGIFKLTQGTALNPAVSKLIKVRAWIYPLPWSGSPGTFETGTANCLGLGVGLGRARPAGEPLTAQAFFAASREEVVYGPLQTVGDARGWIPITFDTDADGWRNETVTEQPINAPGSGFDLAMRLRTGLGTANDPRNPMAFLIAFDTVTHTAAPYPGYPLPIATGGQPDEQARVKDFNCSSSWTIKLAGLFGDNARDQLLPEAQRTTAQYLCTLWQSSTKFIRASLVMGSPTGSSIVRFSVRDGSLAVENVDVPVISDDAMYVLRGSPVLFAVTRSGTTYRFAVSVGGTQVGVAERVLTHAIDPAEIRFGDENMANTEQMEWFGGEINTAQAATLAQMTGALRTLDFLTGGIE